jgi:hypothetical protein
LHDASEEIGGIVQRKGENEATMGTRALIRVFDEGGKAEILCLYRQMDGYPHGPHGLGCQLRAIVDGKIITNGIRDYADKASANGMGCLAALIVAALKGDQVGSVYVYPPGTVDCGEGHVYHVRFVAHGSPAVVTGFEASNSGATLTPVEVSGVASSSKPKTRRGRKPRAAASNVLPFRRPTVTT